MAKQMYKKSIEYPEINCPYLNPSWKYIFFGNSKWNELGRGFFKNSL